MYNHIDEEHGHCLECGEPLYGRTDKKFCNISCKNRYHGHIRLGQRLAYNKTINALGRNYAVLEHLYKLKRSACPVENLLDMGFSTEYTTHAVQKKGKHLEYRCFDFVYNLSDCKLFNLRRL